MCTSSDSLSLIGRRSIAGVAAVLAMWVLVGPAAAQPRPDVAVWLPEDSVPVDEPFAFIIEGSTPAHRGIAFPRAAADSVFGNLEVLSRSDVHTRAVGGGYAIDSVSYTVTTSARDSVRIPPLPIRVDAAAGTLTTFTEPRIVWITDQRSGSPSNARGGTSSSLSGWWWVLIGLLAVGCGGGIYLWHESQPKHSSQEDASALPATEDPSFSPYETATRQLDTLQSSDLSTPDAVESFYVALADVLRAYLSRRWNLATEKRTTQELMTLLERRTDVPPNAIERLRPVLTQSDRVKFAGVRPDPSTAEETLEMARTALDALEASSSPPGPDASSR